MSDKQENLDLEQQENLETPQYTEIEEQAIQLGWNPEGVEGKRNLSAEEFIDRKDLYDNIHSLKRKNKRLEDEFSALKSHYERVAKIERDKAIAELKAAKKQALADEDYDAVVEIDEQMSKAREEPIEESKPQLQEMFIEWKQNNQWYDHDPELRQYADMIGQGYYQQNGGKVSLEDVYAYVTREVKQRFPDKFVDPRERKQVVEGSQRSKPNGKTPKFTENDLPEEARQIMKTLVRSIPGMTKEKYIKEYFGD